LLPLRHQSDLAGCGAADMVDEGDLVPRQRAHQSDGLSGEECW
jgi:hypothetical protein